MQFRGKKEKWREHVHPIPKNNSRHNALLSEVLARISETAVADAACVIFKIKLFLRSRNDRSNLQEQIKEQGGPVADAGERHDFLVSDLEITLKCTHRNACQCERQDGLNLLVIIVEIGKKYERSPQQNEQKHCLVVSVRWPRSHQPQLAHVSDLQYERNHVTREV